MPYFKYALPFLLALFLAGCATTLGEDRGRIAVTYSVLKLTEQSSDIGGDEVLRAVEVVRAGVDGTQAVTAGDLAHVVVSSLDLDSLAPSDQFLAMSVIEQVAQGLVRDAEDGVLPEGYEVELELWLSWIESAAYMAGAGR